MNLIKTEIKIVCIGLLLIVGMINTSSLYSQKTGNDESPIEQSQERTVYNFPAPLNDPGFPFTIVKVDESTPQWAKDIYVPNPDIWEIKRSYDIWRKTNPTVKNGHTRNFRKLYTYLIEHRAITPGGQISLADQESYFNIQTKVRKDREVFKNKSHNKNQSVSTNWELIGPSSMKRTNGELTNTHINVYAITQCLSQPNILYSSTESGRTIFKTIDGGENWFSVSDNLIAELGPRELEVAPNDPDIVYLGGKYDIYKTTEGGNNWVSIYSTGQPIYVHSIIIDPSDQQTVIASTIEGMIKTTDGGITWSTVLPSSYIYDLRFKPGDPQTVYALVGNESTNQTDFYKSTDNGDTWSIRSLGWPTENSSSNRGGRMTTSDGHPHIIYAFIGAVWEGTENKEGIKVMKSSDYGESWKTALNYTDDTGATFPNSGQGFYDWDIEMSDVDSNLVFLGTQGKWVTTDGFDSKTFNNDVGDLGHADVQEILFNGSELWVANDGGIIKFHDETFQEYDVKSNGLTAISFWSFDQGWNRDAQVGTHYHNGTSVRTDTYEEGVFVNHGGAEPSFSLLAAPNADRMVSKGYGSVNGKTIPDDQTEAVNSFNYNIVPNQDGYDGTSLTTLPRAYHTHFVALEDSVMRSDDFGRTWRSIATFSGEYVRGIELTRSNEDVMYVVTDHGSGGKIYQSSDLGASFSSMNQPNDFNLRNAEISASNENSETLYLAGRSRTSGPRIKIAKTIDGGATWTDLWTATLTGYDFRKILQIDGTDGGVYLLTTRAVFYRNNTMPDWIALTEGIPLNASLQYMKPFYKEGQIRVAGSRGVFGAALYDQPLLSDELLQPTVASTTIECKKDTVRFEDYSVLNHNGASWEWSFPGAEYVSDPNIRNPKVLYSQSGIYDVTVSVTQNGSTYSKTITEMIEVKGGCDESDEYAGKMITLENGSNQHIFTDNFDLTTNTLTISAWIKPEGPQEGFTGIVSNGAWCAHCNGETFGLIWNYWGNRLYYRWPGSTSGWGSGSDLEVPLDEWSYIAMVMSPESVTLYVNDEKWSQNISHESADISNLYLGLGHYNKYFNGSMEEVTIWKRALTDTEIKEGMHLTKNPDDDEDLIAYFQFNEEEGMAINKAGNYHGSLINGINRINSSTPIGGGTSDTQNETEGGLVEFANVGFKASYSAQNGVEVVASKLNTIPNNLLGLITSDIPFLGQYWVAHRFGSGALDMNVTFTLSEDLDELDVAAPERIALYGRGNRSDGEWKYINSASLIDADTEEASFNNLIFYEQYLVTRSSSPVIRKGGDFTIKNTVVNTESEISSYVVSGANLMEEVIVTAPTHFQLSSSHSGPFSNQLILDPVDGRMAETTIYVRFLPDSEGEISGAISHQSTGALESIVNVTGFGFVLDDHPGQALSLDGTTDYVNLKNPEELQITGDLTIQMWLRPSDFNSRRNPIGKAYGGEYAITQETDGTLTFYYGQSGGNNGSYQEISSEQALVLDDWNHVSIVRDFTSGTLRWYINGVMTNQTATSFTQAIAGDNEVYIGEGYMNGYAGRIDEVRIWKIALGEDKIRERIHLPLKGNEDGLVACYQFNAESGDAIDHINNLHGTLDNEATRVLGTIPMGSGAVWTQVETDAIVFPNVDVNMSFTTHNEAILVATKINSSPNVKPVDISRVFDEQYWAIHRYGTGAFEGQMIFTIPEGMNITDQFNPVDIKLYGRSVYSDKAWTEINNATAVHSSSGQITFEMVTSFDQFLIGAVSEGLVGECLEDVELENTSNIPLVLGSSTYIKGGNLSGLGNVVIDDGESHLFRAATNLIFEGGFEIVNGSSLHVSMEECPSPE